MDDIDLLRRYADIRCQESFTLLVGRYVDLVYSAALRQLRDPHRADDVTQAVFITLARKAGRIGPRVMLGGWLLQATGYAVRNLLRQEARRKRHEAKAAQMNPTTRNDDPAATDAAWDTLAPSLDECLRRLPTKFRDAIVLRYLEGRSPADVAARMGVSEEAARQRVSRAVAMLRDRLQSRGVAAPAIAALATLLAERSVHAAPAGVTASATGAVFATVPAATALALSKGVLTMFLLNKLKAVAALLVGLMLAASVTVALLPPARGAAPANAAPREITGIVVGPDSNPVANAKVFLADREHPVYVYGDTLPVEAMVMTDDGIPLATRYGRKPANEIVAITGPDGRFTLTVPEPPKPAETPAAPPRKDPSATPQATTPPDPNWRPDPLHQVIVRADEGFAQLFVEELKPGGRIRVSPWGRIEGVMKIGDDPRPGETIYLSRWPRLDDPTLFHVSHDASARTDDQGRFVFERVAPGDVWLTRRVRPEAAAPSHFAYVDVHPGKTEQVTLGGAGAVVGRLVTPPDAPEVILWRDRTHWTEGEVASLPEHPRKRIPSGQALSPAKRRAVLEEWGRTEEGQAFKRSMFRLTFLVNPDGTFTIADVAPGDYRMTVHTTEGPDASERVASLDHAFTVPGPAGTGLVDLGGLEVKIALRLRVGDVAPPFECRALEGEGVLKSSDLKGKYVLLCFLDSGAADVTNFLDELKAIRAGYANDPRLALVDLFVDFDPANARQFAQRKHLDWPQGFLGAGSQTQKDYHVNPPFIFLIAPDGRVAARHLVRESVARTVKDVVGSPR